MRAYRVCKHMGWDYNTFMNQPMEFILAVEHWAKEDNKRQNKL